MCVSVFVCKLHLYVCVQQEALRLLLGNRLFEFSIHSGFSKEFVFFLMNKVCQKTYKYGDYHFSKT